MQSNIAHPVPKWYAALSSRVHSNSSGPVQKIYGGCNVGNVQQHTSYRTSGVMAVAICNTSNGTSGDTYMHDIWHMQYVHRHRYLPHVCRFASQQLGTIPSLVHVMIGSDGGILRARALTGRHPHTCGS